MRNHLRPGARRSAGSGQGLGHWPVHDALESGKSISSLQQIQLAGRLLQNVDSGALAGMKGKAGNIFGEAGMIPR